MTTWLMEFEFENLRIVFDSKGSFRLHNTEDEILEIIKERFIRNLQIMLTDRRVYGGTIWRGQFTPLSQGLHAYAVNDDKVCLIDYQGIYQYADVSELEDISDWLDENYRKIMREWINL